MKLHFRFDHPLPKFLGVAAITLYPFVFFARPKEVVTRELVKHEVIHVEQIINDGWLKFYIRYLYHYFFNLIKYRNHRLAYQKIPYEQAAFHQQNAPYRAAHIQILWVAGYVKEDFRSVRDTW